MKGMILAAGLGTRLKPFTDHHPKALAEVNGKTLLELAIGYFQRFGIHEVIVNVHHFADQIEELIYEQDGFGSDVTISDERDAVLETGGGLKKAAGYFDGEEAFVVMNVDVLTNLDLGKMIAAHLDDSAIATLAVMQRESSRQFLFDEEMILCGWENNKTAERRMARVVDRMIQRAFSGIQILSGSIFSQIPFEGKFSLVDVYLHVAIEHIVRGYDHTGNVFIDVGKPESLEKASYLFE